MKNWRTNLFAILSLLSILAGAVQALIDNNPNTNPDWNAVITQAFFVFGLFAAKDASVTGGTVPATAEAAARLGG